MCVPFVNLFTSINEGDTSWLYYFHGYVGYYVLGYYLQNFLNDSEAIVAKKWFKGCFVAVFMCVSVLLPIVIFVTQVEVDFYSVFWYLSITVALQCVMWWMLVKKFMNQVVKANGFMVELSKLSFGIYLIHILVMRNLLWETQWMQEMNGIVQIVVCAFLTFVISVFISWCLSKVKYVRAVIGY